MNITYFKNNKKISAITIIIINISFLFSKTVELLIVFLVYFEVIKPLHLLWLFSSYISKTLAFLTLLGISTYEILTAIDNYFYSKRLIKRFIKTQEMRNEIINRIKECQKKLEVKKEKEMIKLKGKLKNNFKILKKKRKKKK